MSDDLTSDEVNEVIFHYTGDPSSVTPINVTHLIVDNPYWDNFNGRTFSNYETLVSVDLREGLSEIREFAFYRCTSLREIDIPSSVGEIGLDSFRGCTSLANVTLRPSLNYLYISQMAFAECPLTAISIPSNVARIDNAFDGCSRLVDVTLNDGLEIIEGTFSGCSALTTISIPSTVTWLGGYTFFGCTSLVDITLYEGIQGIGEGCFCDCSALIIISIPSSVKQIGNEAFKRCTSLVDVLLPEGIEVIEHETFEGCTSLTTFLIPSTVTKVEYNAFKMCTRLVSVETNDGLVHIDVEAFYGCKSLVNIALLATTPNFVAYNAFQKCSRLEKAYDSEHEMEGKPVVDRLLTRYEELPVHQVCYKQAYHPTDTTLERLELAFQSVLDAKFRLTPFNILAKSPRPSRLLYQELIQHFPDEISLAKAPSPKVVDKLGGLTPFHIVAMSSKPNCEIFQELMNHYPRKVLVRKDHKGKSPLSYLCVNPSPAAAPIIKMILQDRLKYLGLQRWRLQIKHDLESLDDTSSTEEGRASQIRRAQVNLVRFERTEVASLLEQAVWKSKMESFIKDDVLLSKNDHDNGNDEDAAVVGVALISLDDRIGCRIKCKAEVIVPRVLACLGVIDESFII